MNKTISFRNQLGEILKDVIILMIWSYVFIKLFITNVDNYFLQIIDQEYIWIYSYRLIFLLFILIVIWYLMGNKRFLTLFFYTLFFPLIFSVWKLPKLLFWKIPKTMFKRKKWLLMYSYFNSIINSVYLFKSTALASTAFLISILILIYSKSVPSLYVSLLVFMILIAVHVIQRFKLSFSPIRMFRLNLHLLSESKTGKVDFLSQTVDKFEKFAEKNKECPEKIEENKIQTIETLVISHHFLKFMTNKLIKFKDYKIYMAISMIKVFISLIFCLALITLINYNIYLIDVTSFKTLGSIQFFDFGYYSFHSIFLSSVEEIKPLSVMAKSINMVAPLLGLVVTVFLITLYFSVRSERYKEDIDKVITFSNKQIERVEQIIMMNFSHNLIQALEVLKNLKSPIYKLIYGQTDDFIE